MQKTETVQVAEAGTRQTRNGSTVYTFTDAQRRRFDSFDASNGALFQVGSTIVVTYDEEPWQAVGADGQPRSGLNRTVRHAASSGDVQAPAPAAVAGNGGGAVAAQSTREQSIERQVVVKAVAEVVASLVAKEGTLGLNELEAARILAERFDTYIRTGTFGLTLTPGSGGDDIPF